MTNDSIRRKYLALVARFYELAADHADSELREMKERMVPKDAEGISKAIEALMLLHAIGNSDESKRNSHMAGYVTTKRYQLVSRASRSDVLHGDYLERLLSDQALFSTVKDIARVVPGNLQPQPKESRNRYVKRVVRYVDSLDEIGKRQLKDALSDELAKKPGNFVSQWQNLIREL
jgi:hypothetical protein